MTAREVVCGGLDRAPSPCAPSIPTQPTKHQQRKQDLREGLTSAVRDLVLSERNRLRNRFLGPNQWRRLLCLGLILFDFAVVAIFSRMYRLSMIDYETGTASVIGGVTLAILAFRIARPDFFADWVFLGALHMVAGFMLYKDPYQSSSMAFAGFVLALLSASMLTTWIGATTFPFAGRAWIMAAGITSFLCTVGVIADYMTYAALYPETVADIMLMLLGLSLFGLAISIRRHMTSN